VATLLGKDISPNEQEMQGYPDPDGMRAHWYYENVSQELQAATSRQVQQAATLTEGGPDWGGMWEMARMMQAEQISVEQEGNRSLDDFAVRQVEK
jgi:hypothetical protein